MSAAMPGSLGDLELTSLVGLSEEAARQAVGLAGGTLRAIYEENSPVTADYRPNRVTVWVQHDRVRRVFGIG